VKRNRWGNWDISCNYGGAGRGNWDILLNYADAG